MGLSNDLLTQFAKVTNTGKKTDTETTVYGTVVEYEGKNYVRIDGSDRLTPMTSTTQAEPGERVSIKIKNHTATVTGNISSPAVRVGSVEEIEGKVAVAIDSLQATNAEIDNLKAGHAEIVELVAVKADIEDLNAVNATIENLDAKYATIEKLEAEYAKVDDLDAKYAQIDDLEAVNADIHDLEVTFGKFENIDVDKLEANMATIENLDTKYANIDFANIGEAALKKLFADTGLIKDLTVDDMTITGELVGVTIKGDVIQGNTVIADKLVLRDVNTGLLYKLNQIGDEIQSEQIDQNECNSLNGSIITAKSVTAEKVNVSDLVAFGAKLANFTIEIPKDENGESTGVGMFYSGVKSSVDNSTEGIYLDSEGQMNIGDTSNYLKYYKTEDGSYKLAIAAGSIMLGASGKNVEESIDDAQNSADEANQFADENKTRLENAEASIQILKDAISQLVTDENGASLMTQTSDGWTFNISNIQSALDHTSENLEDLIEEYGSLEAVIAILQSRIDDLDGLAEYVRVGTYDEYDESGNVNTRPCIYLGEGDSDFKLRITNTEFNYMDGPVSRTSVTQDGMRTENMKVTKELTQSGLIEVTDEGDDTYVTEIEYIWSVRSNGNYGLKFQGFLGY